MPDGEGRFYQEADTVLEVLMDRYDLTQAIKAVDHSQQVMKSEDTDTSTIQPAPCDQVQKKSQLDHIGIEMILDASRALENQQQALLNDLANLAEARADARDAEAAAEMKKLLKKKGRKVVKKRKGSSELPPPSEEHPQTELMPPPPARRRLLAPKPLPSALSLQMFNHDYITPMYPDYQPSRGAAQDMGTPYAPAIPAGGPELQAAPGTTEYPYPFFGYPAPPSYYPQDLNLTIPAPQQLQTSQYARPDTPMATTFVHYDGPGPAQAPAPYRQIAPAPGAMLPPPPPRTVTSWDQWLVPANAGAYPPHMSSGWS